MLKINLMNRGASEAISVLGTLTLFAFATMAFSSCSNLLAQAAQTARAEAVSPRMVLSAASGAVSAGANIDFGTVPVGSTCDITLTLENSGKSDLAIDVASIKVTTGNFSVKTNPPATITVGQPGTLILSLAPT